MFSMFFDFVREYWVLSLIYTVLATIIVWRFVRDVILSSKWWHALGKTFMDERKGDLSQSVGAIAFLILVLLPTVILAYLTAPILWLIQIYIERKWQQVEAARYRLEETTRQRREHERREENVRRADARKQWLEKNRLTLYYHTIDGITAVMTPGSLEKAREWTEYQRLDGYWGYENLLCPTNGECPVYIFATKQGREAIELRAGDSISRYKIAGPFSQLYALRKEFSVVLLPYDEIFVPWVNDSVFKYDKQCRYFPD